MASRKPTSPAHASLTPDQMTKGIARLERLIKHIEAFDLSQLAKRWSPEQKALESIIDGDLSSVFGHGTVEYRRYSSATHLDNGPVTLAVGYGDRNDGHEARQYVGEGKAAAIQMLNSAITWLKDELVDADAVLRAEESAPGAANPAKSWARKVFIVHGHDDAARETVARFLERLNFEAIILHEQANKGRTVIEKIEADGDVGFAVVLLTPDDVGGAKGGDLRPRARQNVLLELGYFIAKLGRDRVCALKRGDLELPSDFGGVVYQEFDTTGGWKSALGRELQAVGFEIDWNSVMRT